MLRIATTSISALTYIHESLSAASIPYELTEPSDINLALQLGEIDAFVSELSDSKKQDSVAITALSPRSDASFVLLIANDSKDENQLFRLPENAEVLCTDAMQGAQLLQYKTDIKIQIKPIEFVLAALAARNCVAILIPKILINNSLSDSYEAINFNIKEIIPIAGAGVWAWHTLASDLPTRRTLKPLHNANVAECTNVERTAATLLGTESGQQYAIFCDKNESHFYTLSIAAVHENQFRTERLTNSTTFNLAEDLVERFR